MKLFEGVRKRVALALVMAVTCPLAAAETVSIVLPAWAGARVQFGAGKLVDALRSVNVEAKLVWGETPPGRKILVNPRHTISGFERESFWIGTTGSSEIAEEAHKRRPVFRSEQWTGSVTYGTNSNPDDIYIIGGDDSGVLYGCIELARRIREAKALPEQVSVLDVPAMALRGTCVGMQKTTILPGRRVYEYPYTPDLFPWFYDKALWTEYLDMLVENRLNSLYLWNGHPFASLVRLADYPEAVEVPPDVFEKNVEMFHWLTTECNKRGIWLVQMFYNIFLPKPLAEKHGVPTQLSASTELASDYTRKSIAEFVKQYPNVGLMVCLGEALQGTSNQIVWATQTILPGVLDGMKAAGLKDQPPVVIRTHAMDPYAIIPECFKVYTNLFTETKYNGESLTTYEPRGKVQATHQAMAELGPHIINVHILSNLEPFRYGAQRFIRKAILASLDRLNASGLHLYPLAYWNWPHSPDKAAPPLEQWERDWLWFEAWARYAWNPDIPEDVDRAHWVARLAEQFGSTNAAAKILDAYNDAGECAPQLIRRFGITEGNRQTLSLGMTVDQLVNQMKYGAFTELWESQAPPGERLDEFVRKEWNHEPHVGETPRSVIGEVLNYSARATNSIEAASALVTKNRDEFERLRNDIYCIRAMCENYAAKAGAAELVLRYNYSKDIRDMEKAAELIEESLRHFTRLTALTKDRYHFANSMQTGHRKIPFAGAINGVGTNYHWTQVLPLYKKELDDFRAHVAELKSGETETAEIARAPWPAAKVALLSTNAETYEVKVGARPFRDRNYTIIELAPELKGLTGIRFSHEEAKNGRYTPVEFQVSEPVYVLVGYFNENRDIWLQVPNLDVASHADERGGVDTLIRNAASIQECPGLNVHAFRYEAGRNRLEMIGTGSFVVLGVVPQSTKLEARDARIAGAR